ncbi:uncharacterized protein LOC135399972 [Ornithodoros turicata]|uniref:uncharacterized protein LOC135399972 n=1 Tax=Ornithodoros turicata TaxID=34597 RepID=UPI00313A1F7B
MEDDMHRADLEAFSLMCDEVVKSAKQRQMGTAIVEARNEHQCKQAEYRKMLVKAENLTSEIERIRKERTAITEEKKKRDYENMNLHEDLNKLKLEDRNVVETLQSAKEEGGYRATSHLLSQCMSIKLKKCKEKELLGVVVKDSGISTLRLDLSEKNPVVVARYLWEEAS